MGRLFEVFVIGFKGQRLTVVLCNTEEQFRRLTVLDLRRKILQNFPPNINPDNVRLSIFDNEHLEDDSKLLSEYGIQHESVIQITIGVYGGGHGPEEGEEKKESGNMGDRDRKNVSMECLKFFKSF